MKSLEYPEWIIMLCKDHYVKLMTQKIQKLPEQ